TRWRIPEDYDALQQQRSTPVKTLDRAVEPLSDLRGGPEGVKRWNQRSEEERRAAGPLCEVDLRDCDLRGAWLSECGLARASLQRGNLAGCWAVAAVLREADLRGASLTRANLRGCDCRNAVLAECDFDGATLDGADLCGADLSQARLAGASLRKAR